MTSGFKNILVFINNTVTAINVYLIGLFAGYIMDFKKARQKKIPLILNVVLLLGILLFVFVMLYGDYRRAIS